MALWTEILAAMRYTEAKLSPIASFLVNDIDNETVNFKENYDGTAFEPELLPAEFPNLLINGSGNCCGDGN